MLCIMASENKDSGTAAGSCLAQQSQHQCGFRQEIVQLLTATQDQEMRIKHLTQVLAGKEAEMQQFKDLMAAAALIVSTEQAAKASLPQHHPGGRIISSLQSPDKSNQRRATATNQQYSTSPKAALALSNLVAALCSNNRVQLTAPAPDPAVATTPKKPASPGTQLPAAAACNKHMEGGATHGVPVAEACSPARSPAKRACPNTGADQESDIINNSPAAPHTPKRAHSDNKSSSISLRAKSPAPASEAAAAQHHGKALFAPSTPVKVIGSGLSPRGIASDDDAGEKKAVAHEDIAAAVCLCEIRGLEHMRKQQELKQQQATAAASLRAIHSADLTAALEAFTRGFFQAYNDSQQAVSAPAAASNANDGFAPGMLPQNGPFDEYYNEPSAPQFNMGNSFSSALSASPSKARRGRASTKAAAGNAPQHSTAAPASPPPAATAATVAAKGDVEWQMEDGKASPAGKGCHKLHYQWQVDHNIAPEVKAAAKRTWESKLQVEVQCGNKKGIFFLDASGKKMVRSSENGTTVVREAGDFEKAAGMQSTRNWQQSFIVPGYHMLNGREMKMGHFCRIAGISTEKRAPNRGHKA